MLSLRSRFLLAVVIWTALPATGQSENKGAELARGQTVILGTWTWDIDKNKQGDKKDADVWWQQVDYKDQFLVPLGKAGLSLLGKKAFDKISFKDLLSQKYSSKKIANTSLSPGTVVAVQTNEGNFAKLKVIKYRELHDFSFPDAKYLDAKWRKFALARPALTPADLNYHLEVEWVLYRK